MVGLSCFWPAMAYVYRFLLIYSLLPIISGQPYGWTIKCVAEVFLQKPRPYCSPSFKNIMINVLTLVIKKGGGGNNFDT